MNIFSMSGDQLNPTDQSDRSGYLPVEYIMSSSDDVPVFRIIGYENVESLNKEMERTKVITIGGFLALTLSTLLFALWLFNRFLFVPMRRMIQDMRRMAEGKLDLSVNKKGLRDFSVLADSFESMADQVRLRNNDLELLLDLDDSAILCFSHDDEVVYVNKSAVSLFDYTRDEIGNLDLADLFSNDINQLMKDVVQLMNDVDDPGEKYKPLNICLNCIRKDGSIFQRDAVINSIDVMGGDGFSVVIKPVLAVEDDNSVKQSNQRMNAIEQSLSSLLEIARNNPDMTEGLSNIDQNGAQGAGKENEKQLLREKVVNVMCSALTCWEHDLGKTKLALADESKIWPVYIDKSTPTTRTLDKYLTLSSCPKNPRCQRVVDTAEFVFEQLGDRKSPHQQELVEALQALRHSMSGI